MPMFAHCCLSGQTIIKIVELIVFVEHYRGAHRRREKKKKKKGEPDSLMAALNLSNLFSAFCVCVLVCRCLLFCCVSVYLYPIG